MAVVKTVFMIKGRIPANNATPEGVGGRDGICAKSGRGAWAGAVDGAAAGVRPADGRGGEQLGGVSPCRGEPAHRDTLALRAHDHLQVRGRAALSTHGNYQDHVSVGEVLV